MKKFTYILSILAIGLCLVAVSCSKDIETVETTGIAYGVISDADTGEPIANVSVSLHQGLAWDCLGASVGTAFTGSDGFFQIVEIDPSNQYFIVASHAGYKQNGRRVNIQSGKNTEINITLIKN
ncbi:MAG: carboxypeptidase regulatory-like domain-containing protein [Duncaniella sp.]|nr:carboxypeptidase regulatory-like domain-containing protein [Duncaniella sp.]